MIRNIEEFIKWLEDNTEFGEWDDNIKDEVYKQLIIFLISDPKETVMHSKYDVPNEMNERIENSFTYHSPEGDQPQRYVYIREEAKKLALAICENTPNCREQSLAITKLEECIMWANKAIACNE